jgi:U3 small nucleolar RNA-associated protein 20
MLRDALSTDHIDRAPHPSPPPLFFAPVQIFLPLVTRLVNDPSSKCRAAVGACAGALLRRAAPARRDRLALYCAQWLRGGDARLARAAAQVLGILAEVEAAGFARRVAELLPPLAALLASRADLDAAATAADADGEAEGGDDGEGPGASAPGWQEAYYSLALLHKALGAAPERLAWGAGAGARGCWGAATRLLLHRHAWVRQAAGRVVGAGLADPGVGPPMLAAGGPTAAGALALPFFRQLDSPAADAAMAGQAVKCLVHLALPMYEADLEAGRVPAPLAPPRLQGGAGAAAHDAPGGVPGDGGAAVAAAEDEGPVGEEPEEASAAEEAAAGWLSLSSLARGMARLADNKTFVRALQRGAALRFVAAAASRLGPQRVGPYLPVLLRPLYRITEPGASGNSDEIKALADEIMAHLRALAGSDALLAAYGAAREAVRAQRLGRRQRAAVQTLVDPEAAARRKMRTTERKAAGKRKQLEEVRRLRSVGVVVKHKKPRGREQRE